MSMFGEGQFRMAEFQECRGGEHCSGTHVQFESEEQREMVMATRARFARQREEAAARREHFRQTGVWR